MFHLIFGRRYCHSLFLAAVPGSSVTLILSSRSHEVADGEIFGGVKREGGLKSEILNGWGQSLGWVGRLLRY